MDNKMNTNAAAVQWFPGHMAKTRRLMRENLKLVDIVIELRDARIPYSSENPEIKKLLGAKPRLVVLNKADLADKNQTAKWCEYYKKQGIHTLAMDAKSGRGLKAFVPKINEILSGMLKSRAEKGISGKSIRMMIVGVPNVGKSSLINRLAGGKKAKVEDRPGVTVAKQWVKTTLGIELLDMPGVLWPKFEDPKVGEKLAFTSAVKDDVIDTEDIASRLLYILNKKYRGNLCERYKLSAEDTAELSGYELLVLIGRKRGFLISGGEVDTLRTSIIVLDEFRAGKIGSITLESPEDI